MTRKKHIWEAANKLNPYDSVYDYEEHGTFPDSFMAGAEWADANPDISNVYIRELQKSRDKLEAKLAISMEALTTLDVSDCDNQLEAMNKCHDALIKIKSYDRET